MSSHHRLFDPASPFQQGEMFAGRAPQQKVGGLDAWYTRQRLADALVKLLVEEHGWAGLMLEPHAGSGSIVHAWTSHGLPAVQVDLNPQAPAFRRTYYHWCGHRRMPWWCGDFLSPLMPFVDVDYAVGNVPYSKANNVGLPHVRRMLQISRWGACSILPLYFVATEARMRALTSATGAPSYGYVVTPRPPFSTESGKHEVVAMIWDRRDPGARGGWEMRYLHDHSGKRWEQ